jgi:uncharacterized protein YraI
MKRILSIATFGYSFLTTISAFAADGYVTGDVNLRAGPDAGYPSVAMLSDGAPVVIEGCVDGWAWCDVVAGADRGWVAGNFLQEEYQGQRVLVPQYGVQIGIPIVSFEFGSYWDTYYHNRPWYGQREHWSQIKPRYEPAVVRGDSGSAKASDHQAGNGSGRPGVAAAPAVSQRSPSNAVAQQHPAAAGTRPPERNAKPIDAAQRNAVAPKTVAPKAVTAKAATEHGAAPAKAIAAHNTPEPKAPPREAAEKSGPAQQSGKDKDQH